MVNCEGDSGFKDGEMNVVCTCAESAFQEKPCDCAVAAAPRLGILKMNKTHLHYRDTKRAVVDQYKNRLRNNQVSGRKLTIDVNKKLPTFFLSRRGAPNKHKRRRTVMEKKSSSSSSSSGEEKKVQSGKKNNNRNSSAGGGRRSFAAVLGIGASQ